MFWICVGFLVFIAFFAALDAAKGDWLLVANQACNGVIWWRALHNPPNYWCERRTFWLWWPPGMIFLFAGLVA